MNKKLILLFMFIILFSGNFLVSSSLNEKDKVSEEIYEELENNKTVAVIIKIKPNEDESLLKTNNIEDSIKEQKKIIKNNLKDKDVGETRDLISAEISENELKELEQNKNIEEISISHQIKSFLQDSVPLINASITWAIQTSGINITGIGETICVLDTGIDFTHPDLIGKNKTCIIDCFNKACIEDCSVNDDNGHGTHVAGIVAVSGGINGVAIGANLIGVKVLDLNGDGHATNSQVDLVNAIDWCVLNRNLYNISVITMSLGTSVLFPNYCDSTFTNTWTNSINNASLMNISVIAATGNSGSGILRNTTAIAAPACITNATSVSATDKDDSISSYGHYNSLTDFFAPGTNINSTYNGGYLAQSGTSMATPHVAGAFALLRQFYRLQNSRIPTPFEIQTLLNSTGKRIYDSSTGLYFSRIDIWSALISIDNSNPTVSLVSPSNRTIQFTQNATFKCNANDVLLSNITLYVWNSSGIYNNSNVVNINGVNGDLNVNITNIPSGNYHWNCLAYDSKVNSSFATSNYSLGINLKQMIVIGVDGFQYNHYIEMFNAGQLGNFTRLIANGGWNGALNITGHDKTETAPGNAELITGLNETLNTISSNSNLTSVPDGTTIFERLENFNPEIITGSIYGKNKDYIFKIYDNSWQEINWWHNRTTYSPTVWVDGTVCDNSIDVATKATEFISNYSNNPFYLFVYFGVPDCSGHAAGENSINYNNSLINVDAGLGILLDSLEANNLNNNVQIIVTADHGWNEGTTYHSIANSDTIILPLITNNATLVANLTSDNLREQCEIAPTTLDYFNVLESDYQDIINNGCESMIGDLTPPRISGISSSVSTTSAIISFLTDENANSSVNYGTTNDLGSITNNSSFATIHSVSLLSLSSSTIYYYNITSCDAANNCNTTGTNNFTTSTPTPVVSSSSGGGGGGSVTATTYVATPEQASIGYTKSLSKNDKIKFSFFDAKSEEHVLTITQLSASFVDILIQSEPIKLSLGIGQSAKLNLTSADYYDIYVKLDSIKNNKANITIQLIHEEIPKPVLITGNAVEDIKDQENETLGKNIEDLKFKISKLQKILYLVVAIFIIVILLLLFKEKKYIKKTLEIKKREENIEEHRKKFRQIKPKKQI